MGAFVLSLGLFPLLGVSFFPRSDAGQFTINLKAPTGSRVELTNEYVSRVEDLIKKAVRPHDFRTIVSNIGVVNDLSSLYTTNSGSYTATIQTQLSADHETSSYEYMDRIKRLIGEQFPELRTFVQSGSMVDAVLNTGMPAPIDIQVTSPDLKENFRLAQQLAGRISRLGDVGQVYIPQDMDYPGLRIDVDRVHAAELGLTQKEIVDNVITALNSNAMIAPNYWSDRKTGNNYFLTVQYYENGTPAIHTPLDLKNIPLRAPNLKRPTTLDSVVKLVPIQTPTAVDHYQIQRTADVYVTPKTEDLGRVTDEIQHIVATTQHPDNVRVNLRGMVLGMQQSFRSFAIGLTLSFVLLYLILVAQFKSFVDPVLIMLAIPMGIIGVIVILLITGTTLNVMSLMGVLMLVGIAASNSILIVDFAHRLRQQGLTVKDAVITSCRVRLRPILMTSLATIIGMIPMALKLGTGAEQYAPMAQAIIGGLSASVLLTIFIVPAAYLLIYRRTETASSMRRNQVGGAVLAMWIAVNPAWAGQAPGTLPPQTPSQAAQPATTALTLPQATAIAIKNHPQIGVAQNVASAAGQHVTEARAAYYPTIDGEITGSQGLYLSRLGAGSLSTSLLFSRFGAGLQLTQLVTDFGRTKNLVAQSRYRAQAANEITQSTVYDVVLGVNRAYFGVLEAQAYVNVAEETVRARDTLANQVTELAKAQLKSQVDVSFAEVNLSEAKLLLIRSQDAVDRAYADLARALGQDQTVRYQLAAVASRRPFPPPLSR